MEAKKKNAWMLFMVEDQIIANVILFACGVLISAPIWWLFSQITGDKTPQILKVFVAIVVWYFPQIYLYGRWKVAILQQYRAQIMARNERQDLWFTENEYIIPFYRQLFELNMEEIQRTSKTDSIRKLSLINHDKYGEEILLETDAERKIVDENVYAEYDEASIVDDEKALLQNAMIRQGLRLDYWKDVVANPDAKLSFEDDIYKERCAVYGITFEGINFSIRLVTTSSDSYRVKHARHVEELILAFKKHTKRDSVTADELEKINAQANLFIKVIDRTEYVGLTGGNVRPMVPLGKK